MFQVKTLPKPFCNRANFHTTMLEDIIYDYDKTYEYIHLQIGTWIANIAIKHVNLHF